MKNKFQPKVFTFWSHLLLKKTKSPFQILASNGNLTINDFSFILSSTSIICKINFTCIRTFEKFNFKFLTFFPMVSSVKVLPNFDEFWCPASSLGIFKFEFWYWSYNSIRDIFYDKPRFLKDYKWFILKSWIPGKF